MIEIKDMSKSFGGRTVVDHISLTIQKGKIFGFLGPNGAGKTTTIKILVGLNTPDSGVATIEGALPTELPTRERIGFMPESPYFYDHLTGYEFLQFCGNLFHSSCNTADHVRDLLKEVGLFEAKDALIKTYSKGMKQRLAFASAIVNDPAYLFLDEPLDGLDPIGRKELKRIIKSLNEAGTTIFFNSHILFDTEELCDEIGILNRGSLLYAGPIADFTKGRSLEEQFVAHIESLSPAL
jgi:ABC-2 type transport system ATP-binding protein